MFYLTRCCTRNININKYRAYIIYLYLSQVHPARQPRSLSLISLKSQQDPWSQVTPGHKASSIINRVNGHRSCGHLSCQEVYRIVRLNCCLLSQVDFKLHFTCQTNRDRISRWNESISSLQVFLYRVGLLPVYLDVGVPTTYCKKIIISCLCWVIL